MATTVNTPAPKAQQQAPTATVHQDGASAAKAKLMRPPRELLEPPSDGRLGREELDRDADGNLVL
ncbi:MAG TPA: hypothetical protein PLK06_01045 [bacterium]|nr:hypothetical protein [bacterium]